MKKKVYICLIALCVFLTGCGASAGTGTKKEAEDWRTDKIIGDSGYDGDWRLGIAENDKYVFYLRDDYKIIRFDKEKKANETIVTLKEDKEWGNVNISLCPYEDQLYYIYNSELYQCDLDGKNNKLLVRGKDLKDGGKLKDKKASKDPQKLKNVYHSYIDEVYVYEGKIYFMMTSSIVVLDPETKVIQQVTEIAWRDIHFYNGYIYGFTNATPSMYRTNLETGVEEVIRGKGESEITEDITKYRELFTAGDKLYYSCWTQGGNHCLYEYRENGKDKEVYRINKYGENGFFWAVSDSMKLVEYEYDADKDGKRKITVKDIATGEKKEGEFKGEFDQIMYSIDGNLICSKEGGEKEDAYLVISLP